DDSKVVSAQRIIHVYSALESEQNIATTFQRLTNTHVPAPSSKHNQGGQNREGLAYSFGTQSIFPCLDATNQYVDPHKEYIPHSNVKLNAKRHEQKDVEGQNSK